MKTLCKNLNELVHKIAHWNQPDEFALKRYTMPCNLNALLINIYKGYSVPEKQRKTILLKNLNELVHKLAQ